MALPKPPAGYDQTDQAKTREEIDRELDNRLQRGQDIELLEGRLILQSPDGNRWALGVSNGGATTWTAV